MGARLSEGSNPLLLRPSEAPLLLRPFQVPPPKKGAEGGEIFFWPLQKFLTWVKSVTLALLGNNYTYEGKSFSFQQINRI